MRLFRHIYRNDDAGNEGSSGTPLGDAVEATTDETTTDDASEDDAADDSEEGGEGDKPEAKDESADEEGKGDEKPGEFKDLKLPEGVVVDEAWMDRFVGNDVVKKLGQSDAEGLLGMLGEWYGEQTKVAHDAMVNMHNAKVDGWTKEFQKDPFTVAEGEEQTVALAAATQKQFFAGVDAKTWNETGLGAHPAILVGFAKVAKELKLLEAQMEGGGKPSTEAPKKSMAHKIFGNYAPTQDAD